MLGQQREHSPAFDVCAELCARLHGVAHTLCGSAEVWLAQNQGRAVLQRDMGGWWGCAVQQGDRLLEGTTTRSGPSSHPMEAGGENWFSAGWL